MLLSFPRTSRLFSLYISCRRRCYSTASPRKVLFFGSGDVALETAKLLHQRKDIVESLSVVCPEEKIANSDSGSESSKGILVRKWAMKNNIPIHTYHKEDISQICVEAEKNDLGVVVDFGYLVPRRLLDAFKRPPILMHPSLLPKYRGATPIEYAIIHGEKSSGVSVLTLHPSKFDAGQILMQKRIDMPLEETVKELRPKLARLGAETVAEVLQNFDQILSQTRLGGISTEPASPITAPKLKSSDYWPDWSENSSAEQIYNRWRALLILRARLDAAPDLIPQLDKSAPIGSTIMIHEVKSPRTTPPPSILSPDASGLSTADQEIHLLLKNRPTGTPYFDKAANLIWIKCGHGEWLPVSKLQLPSRSIVDASSFLNGLKIRKPHAVAQLKLTHDPQ